jgi:UDP-N-acetylglucosamine acyltransferase
MASSIHPTAIIDPRAELGADVIIGPFCIVEGPAKIGARTRLVSHVSIAGRVELGEECVVYPFTALGHPPQDFKFKGEDTRLVVGAKTTMREHVTMHPGTAANRGETVVGSNGYFMVGAHIAHDCLVGNNVIFANYGIIGGGVTLGDFVILGGLAGVHQNTRVGSHAFLGAGAIVTGDVIPYGSAYGRHASLNGLNLVGLKRRGFSRETINDLRLAYRLIAAKDGTFSERVEELDSMFPNRPEIRQIVEFIRAEDSSRSLCLPHSGG